VRKITRWLSSIAATVVLSATGCASTTTANNASGGTAAGWHWPWSNPVAPPALASTTDPTSLSSKPPKPGPDLYVATARVYEKSGDKDGAAGQYQKALKIDPGHLPALLGFAQLHDSQREYADADKLYQEAIRRHPKDAAVYNDLGLSYQRRGKFDEAAQSIAKAIQLQPDKQLYRNNIAAVLVEMHRNDEALAQLTRAHGPAGAHYNLAILLHRGGNDREAQYHFAQAAQIDPSLLAAREWSGRLSQNLTSPPQVAVDQRSPALRQPSENLLVAARRPVIVNAPIQEMPALSNYNCGPTEATAGIAPQPTFAPTQATSAQPSSGMRYPQHAIAAASNDGALPPSPDAVSELPPAIEGLRALPPVD
jgi:tetratricopeptide (TPR) repeat protein